MDHRVIYIKSLDELGLMPVTAHDTIGEVGYCDDIWWRGKADFSWELLPSVHRSQYRSFEAELTKAFILRARARYPGPLPNREAWPDWLFLMQHYGLPTRLLDWTRSPFTAATFAMQPPDKKPGAIWAMNPYQWNYLANNTQRLPDPYEKIMLPFFEGAFTGSLGEDKAIAIEAPENDTRMIIQQGVCTIHGTRTPMEMLEEFSGRLIKFIIPAELKESARHYLALHGFNKQRLFPDLHHLAEELREKLSNRSRIGQNG